MSITHFNLTSSSSLRRLGVSFLALTLATGCQILQSPHRVGSPEAVYELSRFEQKELAIGQQIHDRILQTFYLYTEPRVNNYLNQMGHRLAQVSDRKSFPYRFIIISDPKVYATSAPGGFIYITTGFLNFLENEAELAAVLAHEIGQVQYKDPRLYPFKKAIEFLDALVSMVGGAFGQFGLLAMLGTKLLNALTDVKSKDARAVAADKKALQYLVRAGYDPQGLWDVLERIQGLDNRNRYLVFDYQQSRPVTPKRFSHLARNFRKLDFLGRRFDTHRERFQNEVKGIREMYGNPGQGQ